MFVIDTFYLCGPETMITTVKNVLIENNVAKKNIHFELFTTTATNESNNEISSGNGITKVTVLVDEEEETFEMSQKQTILEAAIAKGIDVPYSCQGGICSSCIAKVTDGRAMMSQNNILTDNEVAEGFILTCQAHPTSPCIKVNYDDI